jgi:hypothetical protein
MPSNHPQINARLTAAELAAVKEAAERADCQLADLVRWGLALACAEHGIDWPDDLPRRGEYRRPPHQPR